MKNIKRNNAVNDESDIPLPNIIFKPPVIRRRKVNKVNIKKKTCNECFREYCEKSSIHGLRYLGEESCSKWEKLFWFVVVIISISLCTRMVYIFWAKWEDTPIIVSFDDKKSEIWQLPFPAITICPEGLKALQFNMSLMLEAEDKLTREESTIMSGDD